MAAISDTSTIVDELSWVLALSKTDPKLTEAWTAYLNGDTAGFKAAVLQSDFYKNNNATARQRKTAQVQQPGVYAQDLDSYVSKTKDRLIAAGVQWTPGVELQVKDAYNKGLGDSQLDDLLGAAASNIKVTGGTAATSIDALKGAANSYGVASLLSNSYWDAKSKSLFAGDTTEEDIKKEIVNLASSAYPAYADGFAKGIGLDAQASNVIQTYAKYLEIDPNTLTFDDPRIRRIAQYNDPTTGKPAVMPQWMVEKTVKSDPAWQYTNNARDTLDSLTLKVGRDWGIV